MTGNYKLQINIMVQKLLVCGERQTHCVISLK